MKPGTSPIPPWLCVAATLALTSCEKKRQLEAQLQDAKIQLQDSRALTRTLDLDLRDIEKASPGPKRAKIMEAQKKVVVMKAEIEVLKNRIEVATTKQKQADEELELYQKELAKP